MAVILYKWLMVSLFVAGHSSVQPLEIQKVFHPFYVSVTEINHNATDKTLEISCKMFAEDIEQSLEKNYKMQLDISSDKDKAAFDKYIPDYFRKHLNLVVEGKPVKLTYIGYEKEKESLFCYFQVDNIAALKKLDISNDILYDFNEAEINIMHVIVNGKRQSYKVSYPDKQVSFGF